MPLKNINDTLTTRNTVFSFELTTHRIAFTMPTRILPADDEYQILFTLKALFEKHGYEVRTCLYADEALWTLSNDNTIDLIILDYMLPDLRGDEVALRLSSSHPNLPIIFLSAFQIPDDIRKLADATLTKPVAPEVLLETVREIITREPVPKTVGKTVSAR